jgi:hypothetical protein
MRISDVKRFYVQNTRTDEQRGFCSLTQAVEYAIKKADTNNLIHIGGYNVEYYLYGDTHESLYARCAEIIRGLKS